MFLFLAVLNFALIQPPKATGVYDSGFIRNTQKLFRISLLQFNSKLKILSNLHGFSSKPDLWTRIRLLLQKKIHPFVHGGSLGGRRCAKRQRWPCGCYTSTTVVHTQPKQTHCAYSNVFVVGIPLYTVCSMGLFFRSCVVPRRSAQKKRAYQFLYLFKGAFNNYVDKKRWTGAQ